MNLSDKYIATIPYSYLCIGDKLVITGDMDNGDIYVSIGDIAEVVRIGKDPCGFSFCGMRESCRTGHIIIHARVLRTNYNISLCLYPVSLVIGRGNIPVK